MHIGVFVPPDNQEHRRVLGAFYHGLRELGLNVLAYDISQYAECDVAVVFGIGKKNVPASYARGAIINAHTARKKPVLVLEKGYVRRDEYYAAGWGGLNGRADFRNVFMPSSRWEQLGVEVKEWRRTGKNIIVCGQVPSDASVQHIDIIDWCSNTINKLRAIDPDAPIIFRPHPLAIDRTPTMLHAKTSTRPLAEDLEDAKFVATFNSNAGVESVLAGVPIYAEDVGSMAWDVASKNLNTAFMPSIDAVQQWAYNLAFTQWNLEEMRKGLPWLHLNRSERQRVRR